MGKLTIENSQLNKDRNSRDFVWYLTNLTLHQLVIIDGGIP